MRAFRIFSSCLFAAVAGCALIVQHQWTGAPQLEWSFRSVGIPVRPDEPALTGYRDLWNEQSSFDAAIREFQRALLADIASPYRWCDLGEAFIEADRGQKAKYCLSQAVALGPLSPPILMRAANAYFRLGDISSALRCTRRILAVVPDYTDVIFATYRRMGIGTDRVLTEGLPANVPGPAQVLLRQLVARHSLAEARTAWTWICSRKLASDRIADEYSAALLSAGQPKAAVDCWLEQLGPRARNYRTGNYLFNGGFEHDPLGEAFDWRITQQQSAHAQRDLNVFYSGHSSLSIHFTGDDNVSYDNVSERAFLDPGKYVFEAYVRTAGITTDQGVGFRIRSEAGTRPLSVSTTRLTGTHDWVCVRKEIVIERAATIVSIDIVREPSTKFDCNIAGTAWFDDISLNRMQ